MRSTSSARRAWARIELRTCVGPPLRRSFARLLHTDDPVVVERALALYRERYAVEGWRENEVYAGIDAALAALHRRGHRLMLCTSKPKIYAERIVTHFGLAGYLDAVYGAELGGRLDDKAELMAALLSAEQLESGRCIMIGDRAQDMHAANAHKRRHDRRALGLRFSPGTHRRRRAHADQSAG